MFTSRRSRSTPVEAVATVVISFSPLPTGLRVITEEAGRLVEATMDKLT